MSISIARGGPRGLAHPGLALALGFAAALEAAKLTPPATCTVEGLLDPRVTRGTCTGTRAIRTELLDRVVCNGASGATPLSDCWRSDSRLRVRHRSVMHQGAAE
jgi:hypothetical protein